MKFGQIILKLSLFARFAAADSALSTAPTALPRRSDRTAAEILFVARRQPPARSLARSPQCQPSSVCRLACALSYFPFDSAASIHSDSDYLWPISPSSLITVPLKAFNCSVPTALSQFAVAIIGPFPLHQQMQQQLGQAGQWTVACPCRLMLYFCHHSPRPDTCLM